MITLLRAYPAVADGQNCSSSRWTENQPFRCGMDTRILRIKTVTELNASLSILIKFDYYFQRNREEL
jgi:hypothetical protein